MAFTKLLGASIAALAFGAVLTAGPAAAAPLTPAPVVAPGEPAPGGTSTGSSLIDGFGSLLRQLQCGSAITCGAPA
ncbi:MULTISPECIES: hypothetical protein [Nocardia]|uniref:Uncharacterized protein n=1 Tax=Nocardia rhizosphaerihabitans TaxID=1691570 RepID=A0ABQ2KKX2_9NOCA|nr:hypothetical protein [Nocardia rhizosphaerihabitans]GGN86590.1 hypothetical protein GCM10011610_42060 [Nocardia rhizosphaerihabitans]